MSTLLLLTSALQPSRRGAARARAARPPGQDPARRGQRAPRGPRLRPAPRRRSPGPRPRPRPVPADPHHRHRRARPARRAPRAASPSSPTTGAWTTSCSTPAARPSSRRGSSSPSAGCSARREADDPESHVIRSGEVVVDDATYTAKIGGRSLDLTFKEFELLKFLAQHPGRVFSRQQLLQEVWGYDYFGGTRTVDVHVRRLRAKLGAENETLIGTVRNVGYRFVLPTKDQDRGGRRRRAASRGARSAERLTCVGSVDAVDDTRGVIADAAQPRPRTAPTLSTRRTWLALAHTTARPGPVVGPRRRRRSRCSPATELEPGRAPRRPWSGLGTRSGLERRSPGDRRTSAPGRTATTRPPRRPGAHPRLRPGARAVGDAPAVQRAAARARRTPDGVTVRGYRPSDADEVIRVNAAAFAHHPEQGAHGRRQPGRADGRAVVRPGRAAGRGRGRPGCSASTGPSSTPPELGEVYVVGDRPGRPGSRPRQAADAGRAAPPRRRSACARSCSTSSPTTPPRSRPTPARLHATAADPRAVRAAFRTSPVTVPRARPELRPDRSERLEPRSPSRQRQPTPSSTPAGRAAGARAGRPRGRPRPPGRPACRRPQLRVERRRCA